MEISRKREISYDPPPRTPVSVISHVIGEIERGVRPPSRRGAGRPNGDLDILDCVTHPDGTPILIIDEPIQAWDVETGHPAAHRCQSTSTGGETLSRLILPDRTLLVILLDSHDHPQTWDRRTGHSRSTRPDDVLVGVLLQDGTPVAASRNTAMRISGT